MSRQVLADSGEYLFSYTLDVNRVIQADVTNPRGAARRTTFKA